MSKVIRESNSFVAATLFPPGKELPPVWENLAKQIEPEPKIQLEIMPEPPPSSKKAAPEDELSDPPQFDSDFTAPEPPPGEKEKSPEKQPPPPEEKPAVEKIDIDAIIEEHFNRGLQSGTERAESDYGSSVKALQIACEQLNSIRETILSNSMEEMQNLVLLISEKIIRHSVASQKDTIIQTVKDAIQQAVKSDEFVISVNSNDFRTIKSRSADFINSISGLENIIVKADPAIEQGGCLIESSNCTVDATISSQMELIMEKISSE